VGFLRGLAAVCLLILVAGCKPSPGPYQTAFANLVSRADRVVLVEHSHAYDYIYADYENWSKQEGVKLNSFPEKVYRTLDLDPQQKQRLISAVEATDPKSSKGASACTFEAHHRLEFYVAGKRVNQVEVCFQCGEIEWASEIGGREPDAMVQSLAQFVNSVGYPAKRDWVKMVKAATSK